MDAFNARDLPKMLALLSDGVEVYASPELVNSGHYSGHEGFVSWITSWLEAWEKVSADMTDNESVGERHVITSVHQHGRGRGGIEVSMDLAFLFDVNDEGICTFLAMVPTTEEALRMAEQREAG
jgi:hypothetical protein